MYTDTATESRTGYAERVTRRIKGDLLSLKRNYECITQEHIDDLSHDIELALDKNAIKNFTFYLMRNGETQGAYKYTVNSDGEIAINDRSGRFLFNPNFRGTTLETIVTPHEPAWKGLKNHLKTSWGPANSPSTHHLVCESDGSYCSGHLGVARQALLRH